MPVSVDGSSIRCTPREDYKHPHEYKCKDCPHSEKTRQWVSCNKLKGYIAPIGTIITDCPFRDLLEERRVHSFMKPVMDLFEDQEVPYKYEFKSEREIMKFNGKGYDDEWWIRLYNGSIRLGLESHSCYDGYYSEDFEDIPTLMQSDLFNGIFDKLCSVAKWLKKQEEEYAYE